KIEDSARDITAAIEEPIPISLEEESVAQEEITLDDGGVKEDMDTGGIEEISLDNHDVSISAESLESTISLDDLTEESLKNEEIDKENQDETK
ncbi:MAG: hypothetical protein SV062_10980, partial [Thermodesulfobacteriota bacterium]|nr:hypothetical protein [Thermodesulfobacteriota bacterium]